MKNMIRQTLLCGTIAVLIFVQGMHGQQAAYAQKQQTLYYFYGKNCPHCAKAEPIIQHLARRYQLRLEKFEVWYNADNRNKLIAMAKERGKNAQGVPTIIIGKAVYTGSNEAKLEEVIKQNSK
jgi:thiol-disulfide isomerase/thioredoxin